MQGGARGGAFGQRRGAVSIVVWMRRTWRTRRTCQKCTVHGNGTTIKTHAACIIKPRPLLRFDPGPDPACRRVPLPLLCAPRSRPRPRRATPTSRPSPRRARRAGQPAPPGDGRTAGGGRAAASRCAAPRGARAHAVRLGLARAVVPCPRRAGRGGAAARRPAGEAQAPRPRCPGWGGGGGGRGVPLKCSRIAPEGASFCSFNNVRFLLTHITRCYFHMG